MDTVFARDNYRCSVCGKKSDLGENNLLELDYKKTYKEGGKTELSNLQTICWKCAAKKRNSKKKK